ncbi:Energy-coupling factor transporter transmembrane protein EcfT [Methanonatronarchaeum thermophilum]|uniref:Energy-coupling factor transporter transmembrane protein EcfT n=1 Tax=Methanonatronarchaeum thermophilum TaxID=1927129 RepID=A0A1Y3GD79_9EURY|nr:cobalt ECF transporter T component CbiQ [Methanonatronarchaeum thermophilum]OUJ18273.1 Energy-coupling factor transporter transmembrane protein EcfT [Methanonatronarchaeum thermophilum]
MKNKNLYINGNTFLHNFNPKTKIISTLILITSIVLLQNLIALTIALTLIIGIITLSKLPIKKLIKRLKWIFLFAAAIFLFVPFFTAGDPVFTILFLTATYEGLTMASIISLKMISIMTLSLTIIMTTKIEEILRALNELGIPQTFIEIFFLTYKYIFVIYEETEKSMMSAKARGYKPKAKPSKLKILGNIIGMIFVRSYDRSQRVHKAMMARGYRGTMTTTINNKINLTNKDILLSFSTIILAITLHLI